MMKKFYYRTSITLKRTLSEIEEVKKKILLYPLSPQEEVTIRWKYLQLELNSLQKLYFPTLRPLPWEELLSLHSSKKISPSERTILQYKKGFDYIKHKWILNTEPLEADIFREFEEITRLGKLSTSTQELEQYLHYINSPNEHPLIQAALYPVVIHSSKIFTSGTELMGNLFLCLRIYQAGYDLKQMYSPEYYFLQTREKYQWLIKRYAREDNLTDWLDYFIPGILFMSLDIYSTLQKKNNYLKENYPVLLERHKDILTLLENPSARITNKDVQKKCKVSQITASRDLAKLSALGLVFPAGKGRSVYYTRV